MVVIAGLRPSRVLDEVPSPTSAVGMRAAGRTRAAAAGPCRGPPTSPPSGPWAPREPICTWSVAPAPSCGRTTPARRGPASASRRPTQAWPSTTTPRSAPSPRPPKTTSGSPGCRGPQDCCCIRRIAVLRGNRSTSGAPALSTACGPSSAHRACHDSRRSDPQDGRRRRALDRRVRRRRAGSVSSLGSSGSGGPRCWGPVRGRSRRRDQQQSGVHRRGPAFVGRGR